jgi:hypothetical protein
MIHMTELIKYLHFTGTCTCICHSHSLTPSLNIGPYTFSNIFAAQKRVNK